MSLQSRKSSKGFPLVVIIHNWDFPREVITCANYQVSCNVEIFRGRNFTKRWNSDCPLDLNGPWYSAVLMYCLRCECDHRKESMHGCRFKIHCRYRMSAMCTSLKLQKLMLWMPLWDGSSSCWTCWNRAVMWENLQQIERSNLDNT